MSKMFTKVYKSANILPQYVISTFCNLFVSIFSHYSKEETLGIYSYGIANEAYDPSSPALEITPNQQKNIFDSGETGDIFDDVFIPRASTGSGGEVVRQESHNRDDPAFWGNLAETFNNYQMEMQPIDNTFTAGNT